MRIAPGCLRGDLGVTAGCGPRQGSSGLFGEAVQEHGGRLQAEKCAVSGNWRTLGSQVPRWSSPSSGPDGGVCSDPREEGTRC